MLDWLRSFPHWLAHTVISIGIGAIAVGVAELAVLVDALAHGFLLYPWAMYAGAAFYTIREAVQYANGKRHKGRYDWEGFLAPLGAAALLDAALPIGVI